MVCDPRNILMPPPRKTAEAEKAPKTPFFMDIYLRKFFNG